MEVTTVSHAGIANRIKNILSAMAQYDKVNTLYDTINYIFPSIPKVDNAVNTFPEDWRLHVDSEEEQYIENYKTELVPRVKPSDRYRLYSADTRGAR